MSEKIIHKNRNSINDNSEYIPEYDIYRSVAIILVVAYHYFGNKIQSGFIGVDIFFTLSGCVISRSIINQIYKNHSFSIINFFKKRILRIFPNISLYIVLTLVLLLFSGDIESIKYTSIDIIKSLLFISNLSITNPDDYFKVNDSGFFEIFWSLSIEEQFYFILPFLILLSLFFAKIKNKEKINNFRNYVFISFIRNFYFTTLILSILSLSYFFYNLLNNEFHYANTLSRFWQLSLGIIITLFLYRQRILLRKKSNSIIKNILFKQVFFSISIISLIVISFLPISRISYPNHYSLIVTCITFLGLIITPGAINKNNLIFFTPFLFIGKISFSWYLWHWFCLEASRFYSVSISSPFVRLIILIFSLLISVIIYLFFEQKIRYYKFKNSHFLLVYFYLILFIPSYLLYKYNKNFPLANKNQTDLANNYSFDNSLQDFLLKNNYRNKLKMNCDINYLRKKSPNYDINNFFREKCFPKSNSKNLKIGFFGDSHAQQYINAITESNYDIYPLIGSGCLPINIFEKDNNKKHCRGLKSLISNQNVKKNLDVLIVAFDLIDINLIKEFLLNLVKENENLKVIVMGPSPHWENYLPKIAIRNLRGITNNIFSDIALNNSTFIQENILKETIKTLSPKKIFYFSVIDELCIGDKNKKCLVGFNYKDGPNFLTSYDKSHLTLDTTEKIIKPNLEKLIEKIISFN